MVNPLPPPAGLLGGWIYSVQSLKGLTEVIIPHFKEYPLLTQKQADFIFIIS